MADALGAQWARAGHGVLVGGRDVGRAAELARRRGARSGTLREAAESGTDAVLMALPWRAAVELAADLREFLRDRVLIDCTNPVGPGFTLETASGPSAAERLATAAPAARVVKAFNLCHEDVWCLTPPVFAGCPPAVPLCADDEGALSVVRQLVRTLGCEPLNAGGLSRAGLLAATAAVLSGLWVGEDADAQAIAPPREFAGER